MDKIMILLIFVGKSSYFFEFGFFLEIKKNEKRKKNQTDLS